MTPVTSPPVDSTTFDIGQLEGRDLIYLDLHGMPGDQKWFGQSGEEGGLDRHVVALTAYQVKSVCLYDAVVFAATCHLADSNSPMLDALLDAGARYVIGGEGVNWNGLHNPIGAGLLGQWFRRGMQIGGDPLKALVFAKDRVRLSLLWYKVRGMKVHALAARDALAFRAYERRE